MAQPVRKVATYQDVLGAPEHMVAEIIAGELVLSPRPSVRHANAASELGGLLRVRFGRRGGGGWLILDEPELHLNQEILVPDIAGWRAAAAEQIPSDAVFVTIAPNWLCEVLSPSTERIDRTRKTQSYAAAGVEWLWLVHPGQRFVEVRRLEGGQWHETGVYTDGVVRLPPFEDVELNLNDLWMP